MFKVGYYDDENRQYDSYRKDFALHKIELIRIENIFLKSEIRDFILENKFDAIIIDFCLDKFTKLDFKDGNELTRYLNTEILDFPTIILTSYAKQSREEKLVSNTLIFDRNVLASDTDGIEYTEFINLILNSIEVFRKRMLVNKEEFEELFAKKKKNSISSFEEDRLMQIYRNLFSYELIDEINPELLRRSLEKKMDDILVELRKITGE
ncbi:MAG: hypothetical protein FWC00_01175 [Firmicutes bacterium]|nr:hypothetical protein [Bacillota bacterium]